MNATAPLLLWAWALPIGLAGAGLVWGLLHSLPQLPTEERRYHDPPPWAFRLCWWPIRHLANAMAPRLGAAQQARWGRTLQAAGLERALNPSQWLAGWFLLGALCSLLLAMATQWWLNSAWSGLLAGLLLALLWPPLWLRDRRQQREQELLRALPFYLDLMTLCVEAGLNLHGALEQAVTQGPRGPLRTEFQKVLRDLRAGRPRQDSLQTLADRVSQPAVARLCQAINQSEQSGSRLGPVLRAQADQRRQERFQRAEKRALEAPVKMLLPLIAFIFPCTFLVLMFPIAVRIMQSGW